MKWISNKYSNYIEFHQLTHTLITKCIIIFLAIHFGIALVKFNINNIFLFKLGGIIYFYMTTQNMLIWNGNTKMWRWPDWQLLIRPTTSYRGGYWWSSQDVLNKLKMWYTGHIWVRNFGQFPGWIKKSLHYRTQANHSAMEVVKHNSHKIIHLCDIFAFRIIAVIKLLVPQQIQDFT